MIYMIVCTDVLGGIGNKGDLLVRIPEDMRRFRELTEGHVVIMGRKTWTSIGSKPLKDRTNIVITSQKYLYMSDIGKCYLYNGVDTLINRYKDSEEEVFVIGGASIYKEFLPYCKKIYWTIVHDKYEADTYFPYIDRSEWDIEEETMKYDPDYMYSFATYTRKEDSMTKEQNKHIDAIATHIKNTETKADVDPRADEGFDPVERPSHYAAGKIEVIDFIEELPFNSAMAIRYVARAGKKCPGDKLKEIQDLEKARWYVNRRIKQVTESMEVA